LDPRFEGSNPVEDDGFLRAIKICTTTSVRGEVKPSVPCRKILRHVKDSYSTKEIFLRQNSRDISRQVSPSSLLDLVDESGMTRTQMGKTNRSVMVAVYGTPCVIPTLKK
jgi:hypothetical protein